MKQDKVLSLLGLAARGRNVVSGEFATEKAVKTFHAELVIVAEDASDNTKKMFRNMCEYYEVRYYEYAQKEELGHAIGRQFRASLAVTEKGLADAIEKQLKLVTE
ncbi:MAG: L7Ae/L30e/S12e/Gadd45 family ribosomal protein [Lachnospiraceae bacterium]